MYSGSDSNESQKFAQWARNSSSFNKMASDQVDWAALAQQWIIMKEAGPPPIPGEQPNNGNSKKGVKNEDNEGGEAPMEVENEKDEPAWNNTAVDVPPPPGADPWSSWGSQNAGWGWDSTWSASAVPHAAQPTTSAPPNKVPLLPTPSEGYHTKLSQSNNDNAAPFGGYPGHPSGNDYNSGYWTNMQSKQIKPHNKRYSKVNVPIKAPVHTPPAALPIVTETPIMPTLDANRRKQLPAWIREGLEKMEKDKLKQMEREKEKQALQEYDEKVKQSEKEKMEILKDTIKEQQHKSRFESEDDSDDHEESPINTKKVDNPIPVPLSQDELMLKVRKTMTEILLKVTNEHIEQVCKEERQRYLKRNKAADQIPTAPTGAIISAKLGLGAYNEESDSSDDDEPEEEQRSNDSDAELKDTIRRKVQSFARTEQEIEDKLADAESKKANSPSRSRSTSPETNDSDSQVDARPQAQKISHSPENKTPPRTKEKSRSPSSDSSNYLTTKTRSRRSSSESDRSYKKSYKGRSRSRSKTPERRYKSRKRSESPPPKRRSRSKSRSSRRDSNDSKKRSRRSRSRSYSSRSRRSRSSSYYREPKSRSKRSRSRSTSRYSRKKSRSRSRTRSHKRSHRSRSTSSGRGKRSHRY